jgi:hypothetical protein
MFRLAHQPLTIADLAVILEVPRSRVARALERYGILPAYRVGKVKCYTRGQLDTIAELVARHRS